MFTWFTGLSAMWQGAIKIGAAAALLTLVVVGIFNAGSTWNRMKGELNDARHSSSAADAQRDVYDDHAPGVRSPYAATD